MLTNLARAVLVLSVCCATVSGQHVAVHGTVNDGTGASIGQAQVYVQALHIEDAQLRLATTTSARGFFEIKLDSGYYRLLILSPGFKPWFKDYRLDAEHPVNEFVTMVALPCSDPSVNCDDFGYALPKKPKKSK